METMMLTLLFLLLSPIAAQQHDDDYVDPTDLFNFDPANVRMKTAQKPNTVSSGPRNDQCEQTGSCTVPNPQENDSDVDRNEQETARKMNDSVVSEEFSKMKQKLESSLSLSRQYVNKLVHLLESKVGTASSPVEINLRLRVSYEDIVKLRKFGQSNSNEVHSVYETLNYIVQYASDSLQPESPLYWLEMKLGLSSEVLLYTLAIVICILLMLFVLLKITVTKRLISGLIFVTFIVSVILNWIEMYQQKRADQEKILMLEKLGDRCPQLKELSFLGRISTYISSAFTFQEENCKEYFQAMLVNPLVTVSPIEAVSVAIVKTVVTPLGIIGTGIKAFLVGLLKDLPQIYQMVLIAALPIIIILMLFFYCGYCLKIFGLVSLGPSENRHFWQRLPHINQHHVDNGEYHHMQGPLHLQRSGPQSQELGIEGYQRPNNALREAHNSDNRAGIMPQHMDVSGQVEQVNRRRVISVSNNVNHNQCMDTPAAPVFASHTAARQREEYRKCQQKHANGHSQESAAISNCSVIQGSIREANMTVNRTLQSQQETVHDLVSPEANTSPVIQGSLQDVTESRQHEKQDNYKDDDDKDAVNRAIISSSFAHANQTEENVDNSLSHAHESEMGLTESLENMNISRNS